jgi:nitrite reductase/ring-hydroxylating ferredoxin subunit
MDSTLNNVPAQEPACDASQVPSDGSVMACRVNGRQVALARHTQGDETIVAFDSLCPHMQAPFRFGRVVNGEVICPWHFFRFNVLTGETVACDKSLMKIRSYPVQVIEGKVYLQVTD